MREYTELKDKLCEELDEITREIVRKSDLNDKELETIHKLTDTIKNIDKIHMLDENGYSGAGELEAKGHFGDEYVRHHDGGSSYTRSRKRDNMGRYSRKDGKEHMISKLEDMMDETDNDRVKSAIRKCINELERE